MKKIFEYDCYDEEVDWESESDYLMDICKSIIFEYDAVLMYGFFGAWNGPKYQAFRLRDPGRLFDAVARQYNTGSSFTVYYTEKDDTVEEIQRYCSSTALDVPACSLVVLQNHHDGCNQYVIRPLKDPDVNLDECDGNLDEILTWCKDNTKDMEEKVLEV